jgi:MYXO-CTERM domain-containing protein
MLGEGRAFAHSRIHMRHLSLSKPRPRALTFAVVAGLTGLVACRAGHEDADRAGARISEGPLQASAEKSLALPDGTSGMRASHVALSRGAAGGLLVWKSDEVGTNLGKGELVYAAPITAAGAVADPAGTPLFEAGREGREKLSLDFDGTNHAVMTSLWGPVTLRRVSPEGRLLDTTPPRIVVDAPRLHDATIAFDGTNHLVVWALDTDDDDRIQGARFSRDLSRLTTTPIEIGILSGSRQGQRVRAAGARDVGLVAWTDERTASAKIKRIAPDGTVTDLSSSGVVSRGKTLDIAVTSDGDDFLVARRTATANGWQLEVQRLSVAGEAVAVDPAVLAASGSSDVDDLNVAFDGSRYLVTWLEKEPRPHVAMKYVDVGGNGTLATHAATPPTTVDSSIHGVVALSEASAMIVTDNVARGLSARTLDASLVVTETTTIGIRESLQDVRGVAASKDAFLVVYSDDRVSNALPMVPHRVFAQTIGGGGAPRATPVVLGDDYGVAADFALASDGEDFLVLDELRGNSQELRARRVGKDGSVLDAQPILFASPTYDTRRTVLVWDGTYYSAIFTTTLDDTLYRTRIRRDGTVVDATPVAIATAGRGGTIGAFNAAAVGNVLIVAWRDRGSSGSERLFAMRKVGEGRPESFELGIVSGGLEVDVVAGAEDVLVATRGAAFAIGREAAPRSIPAWKNELDDQLLFDGASFLRVGSRLDAAANTRSFSMWQLDTSQTTGSQVESSRLTIAAGRGTADLRDLPIAGAKNGRSLAVYEPVADGVHLPGVRFRTITNKTEIAAPRPDDDAGVTPPAPDSGPPGSGISVEPAAPSEAKGTGFAAVPTTDASATSTCSLGRTPNSSRGTDMAVALLVLAAAGFVRRSRDLATNLDRAMKRTFP